MILSDKGRGVLAAGEGDRLRSTEIGGVYARAGQPCVLWLVVGLMAL